MKRLLLSVLAALFTISLIGQSDQQLRELVSAPAFDHAIVGVSAARLSDGQVVMSYQDDLSLQPASCLKILTTFSALDILGDDHRYRTSVYTRGDVDASGTLHGDLIIMGSGDPTLASPDMKVPTVDQIVEQIIIKLSAKGIKCIDGDIIINQGVFDPFTISENWVWNDLANYYAAGAYGFNVLENTYKLYLTRSTQSNKPVSIDRLEPSVPLDVVSHVQTGPKGSGDEAYIYGDPYGRHYTVEGTIPPGKGLFSIKGAIPNPAGWFGAHLQQVLQGKGIKSNDARVTNDDIDLSKADKMLTIKSLPLRAIVDLANVKSKNIYCEALLRTLPQARQVTAADGIEFVEDFVKKKGLDQDELQMVDGSGLSPFNRVTASFFTDFLVKTEKGNATPSRYDLLPEVGVEGTVKWVRLPKEMQGRVWQKSGYISGVISYTGWIQAKSGEWIATSIMVNGHTANNAQVRKQIFKIWEHIYEQY